MRLKGGASSTEAINSFFAVITVNSLIILTMLRSFVIIAALLCAQALGHAVMDKPISWNTSPSTTQNCGGGTAPTTPPTMNTWVAGQEVSLVWRVVAGDGVGPVTIRISNQTNPSAADFNPATADATSVLLYTLTTPNSVSTFTAKFIAPNMTCPAKGCYIQAKSSSNWASCASIAILGEGTPVPPVAPPPKSCKRLTGLTFCGHLNGANAAVPLEITNQQLPNYELGAARLYDETLDRQNRVLINWAATDCQAALKYYYCQQFFPACGEEYSGVCSFWCNNLGLRCNVNETHALLYDCTNAPAKCSPAVSAYQPVSLLVLLAMAFVYFVALY